MTQAQPDRWQQRGKIHHANQYGCKQPTASPVKQKLEYTNNSPDVLNKLFYHLYYCISAGQQYGCAEPGAG